MRCFKRWSSRPWWRPFRDKRGVERSISKVYFDHTLITRRVSVGVAGWTMATSAHLAQLDTTGSDQAGQRETVSIPLASPTSS